MGATARATPSAVSSIRIAEREARAGDGSDLIAALESRLALDTVLVQLEFDASSDSDRERISYLYRVGRVQRHESSSDGRVLIDAELPRRVMDRYVDREVEAS